VTATKCRAAKVAARRSWLRANSAQTDTKGDLAKSSVRSRASGCYELAHTRFVALFTPLACIRWHRARSWNSADDFLSSS
jgi:hypothetical protein